MEDIKGGSFDTTTTKNDQLTTLEHEGKYVLVNSNELGGI